MSDIYKQHQAAFKSVSAYVVFKNGERVATIAFKFPKDGAGRLYAYVHWIGTPMARGFANGYGYDKRTAAVASAAEKHCNNLTAMHPNDTARAFWRALEADRGPTWDSALREAGFTVWQAV